MEKIRCRVCTTILLKKLDIHNASSGLYALYTQGKNQWLGSTAPEVLHSFSNKFSNSSGGDTTISLYWIICHYRSLNLAVLSPYNKTVVTALQKLFFGILEGKKVWILQKEGTRQQLAVSC